MVYIASWHDYQEAAEALYAKSPNNTRYCVKWKSSEGKLVLKITDNVTCLKFKTYSSMFLNRFEALNLSLMQKMQNRRPPPTPPPTLTTAVENRAASPETRGGTPIPSNLTPGAPTVSAGGVKKKKPKKKK